MAGLGCRSVSGEEKKTLEHNCRSNKQPLISVNPDNLIHIHGITVQQKYTICLIVFIERHEEWMASIQVDSLLKQIQLDTSITSVTEKEHRLNFRVTVRCRGAFLLITSAKLGYSYRRTIISCPKAVLLPLR